MKTQFLTILILLAISISVTNCAAPPVIPTPTPTLTSQPTQTFMPTVTLTITWTPTPTEAVVAEVLVDETLELYKPSVRVYEGVRNGIKLKVGKALHESVSGGGPPIKNIEMGETDWAEAWMKIMYAVKAKQGYRGDYETWRVDMISSQNGGDTTAAEIETWVNDLTTAGFKEEPEKLLLFPGKGVKKEGFRLINEVHFIAIDMNDASVVNIKITDHELSNRVGQAANVKGDVLYIYLSLGYGSPRGANDVLDLAYKHAAVLKFLVANQGGYVNIGKSSPNMELINWFEARLKVTPTKK